MVRRKPEEPQQPLPPPATTLEGREQQLISAAMDLIERRLRDGTATSQETVHFAKQGSILHQRLLKEKEAQIEMLNSRVKELESRTSGEAMYAEALKAFRGYVGADPVDPEADEVGEDY